MRRLSSTFSLLAAEYIRDQVLGRPNSDAELFGFGREPAASPADPRSAH